MKKIGLLLPVLLFAFIMAGCGDEEEPDYSISEITIYNIPAQIPVDGGSGGSNEIYKVYLNASDYQDENMPSAAKGWAEISDGTISLLNGTYTVKIKLQNPAPKGTDPTTDTGSWSGTAKNFSVTISPKNVTAGENVIWVKAGLTLDKGKETCDWDKDLMDLRKLSNMTAKIKALFDEIVCQDKDPEMTRP